MMQKIAITGNMGTGKTTAGNFLHQRGETVLDLDEVTKKLYQKRRNFRDYSRQIWFKSFR